MTGIIESQARLHAVEQKVREARETLKLLEDALAEEKQKFRGQIARSLTSKNNSERQMAESIADWWEVRKPSISSSPLP